VLAECQFIASTGANAQVLYNVDERLVPLDGGTGPTPASAPVMDVVVNSASQLQLWGAYPNTVLVANGTSGTTYIQRIPYPYPIVN
jgi:hypothetical protein